MMRNISTLILVLCLGGCTTYYIYPETDSSTDSSSNQDAGVDTGTDGGTYGLCLAWIAEANQCTSPSDPAATCQQAEFTAEIHGCQFQYEALRNCLANNYVDPCRWTWGHAPCAVECASLDACQTP